jgi:hypothetical protein
MHQGVGWVALERQIDRLSRLMSRSGSTPADGLLNADGLAGAIGDGPRSVGAAKAARVGPDNAV